MKYHRVYLNGGTYFFTLVTYKRTPIFSSDENVEMLRKAIDYTLEKYPLQIIAFVILPDHLHYIWTLPEGTSDYSTRWRLIKSYFTRKFYKVRKISEVDSRKRKGEQDIWQRRFWEHLIRDENDLTRHIEYIHYNPVKHGLVNTTMEWKYSSFMDYVDMNLYPIN